MLSQRLRHARLPEPLKRFALPAQIFLWFSCSMVSNLMTKQLLNVLPAPLALHSAFNLVCVSCSMATLAAVEAARGATCELPGGEGGEGEGGLPDLRLRELLSVDAGRGWRQGVLHATTHAASMAVIGGVSLCYAHTVKATEPLFSAIIAVLFFGKQLALRVWLSLVPIIGGVAYASFTFCPHVLRIFPCNSADNVADKTLYDISRKKACAACAYDMNPTAPRRGFGAPDGRRTRPARCAGRGPARSASPAPMLDAAHEQESNKPATHSSTQKPLPGRVWRHALRLMTPAVPARANGAGNGVQRAARAGGVPSEGGGRARWDGAKVGVSERVKPKRVANACLYHSFTMHSSSSLSGPRPFVR